MTDFSEDSPRTPRRRTDIRFTISIAAEMINVHAQTLRHYERIGLIAPQRSEGKIRYYTMDDIERLDSIKHLIEERKVNLAGVEAILELQANIAALKTEHDIKLVDLQQKHEAETERLKSIIRRIHGREDGTPIID